MTLGEARKPDIEAIRRQFATDALARLDAESKGLLKSFPGDRVASHLNYRGVELFSRGDYSQALVYFNGAVANKPNDVDMWVNRANCLYNLKRFDEATGSAERALELNPNNALGLNMRGLLYAYAGDHQKAYECYSRAHELMPGEPVLKANMEQARQTLGQTQKPAPPAGPPTQQTQQGVDQQQLRKIGDVWAGAHLPTLSFSGWEKSPLELWEDICRSTSGIHANNATIQAVVDLFLRRIYQVPLYDAMQGHIIRKAGFIISNLINNSPEQKITLNLGGGGRQPTQ